MILAPAAKASPTGQRHSPGPRSVISFAPDAGSSEKENSTVLPEEDEEVGGSPYAAFKAAIARAKDPSLSPGERRKAGLDVALQMLGHPSFHDIDAALAGASEMSPDDAEIRKAALAAISGNVRVMLCMTGGSVVTTQDCEEYLARLPAVYKREVLRSFKEHRPLDLASLGYSPM
jgi:hypothetical protein